MKVAKLQLTNFRNHQDTAIEFSDGINLITGANAQGKTSILEGLSYICLTRSFLQQSEKSVVKAGSDSFIVDSTIHKAPGTRHDARVVYDLKVGKRYSLDGNDAMRAADIIGMFPVVVLHPGNFSLTAGGPSERRRFLDMILSQVSRSYLEELVEYGRALRQRNKILLDGKLAGRLDAEMLDAWTDALVDHGARVIARRKSFVNEFQEMFSSAYASLVNYGEKPGVTYVPSFQFGTDIGADFKSELRRVANIERARGATLAGPHRDDLEFTLNGFSLKDFASQGQNKTTLVALKITEFNYIKAMVGETPIVLLDDVMSELDSSRSDNTMRAIAELGQTFVTATDMANVYGDTYSGDGQKGFPDVRVHLVKDGTVVYENV